MAHTEFQALTEMVRRMMRTRKLRYSHLAKRLKVSEATIKRFFAASDGSMGRLVEICEALEISFADLVAQTKRATEPVFELSEEQEEFYAKNSDHHFFFQELVDAGLSFQEIQVKHELSKASAAKYARQLEKLGLADWLGGDRLKLKVKGTLNWLDHGPLFKKYQRASDVAFLDHMLANFGKELHFLTSSERRLHPHTLQALATELQSLLRSFRGRVYRDEVFYPNSQLVPVRWLIAIGPYSRAPVKLK